MRLLFAAVSLALALIACTELQVNEQGPSISEMQSMPLDEARSHLAGQTVLTYVDRHQSCPPDRLHGHGYCAWVEGPGTQLEFFAEDGRWFLWSPDQTQLIEGEWVLRTWRDRYHICFAPSDKPLNVLSRFLQEDGYRCASLAEYARKVTDARASDVFGLESGKVPYLLNAEPSSIDKLLSSSRAS